MSDRKETVFDLLIDHNIDIRGRVLYLNGEIEEESANKFIKLLKYLDKTDGDIEVVLNSGGGCVASGFAIHDAIKGCKNPITVLVMGECMSIATIILQAADNRVSTKYARFMIHRMRMSDAEGDLTNLKRMIEDCLEVDKVFANIYLERIQEVNPDYKMSQVQKIMDFDTYFSADKALELGLIDEIEGSEDN